MPGISLNALVTGKGEPLVILHGLFGSARNWNAIARGLADIREVHALDLRNHGSSPWTDAMGYDSMAEDVADYIHRAGLAPTDLLGHSMGGKTAMLLAIEQADLLKRLIVVDIAPVAYRHTQHADAIETMRQADLGSATRRAEIERQMAGGIPDAALRAFLLQNLATEDGKLRWRLNLPVLAESLPTILDFPQSEGRFDGPTLFLAGEHSDYIRPRDEATIRRYFPQARLCEIAQSGHWPHADQTDRFLALVRNALQVETA